MDDTPQHGPFVSLSSPSLFILSSPHSSVPCGIIHSFFVLLSLHLQYHLPADDPSSSLFLSELILLWPLILQSFIPSSFLPAVSFIHSSLYLLHPPSADVHPLSIHPYPPIHPFLSHSPLILHSFHHKIYSFLASSLPFQSHHSLIPAPIIFSILLLWSQESSFTPIPSSYPSPHHNHIFSSLHHLAPLTMNFCQLLGVMIFCRRSEFFLNFCSSECSRLAPPGCCPWWWQ